MGNFLKQVTDPADTLGYSERKKAGPGQPSGPNFERLIELQGRENRINEVGPSGSTIYSRGSDGVWTANRSFSPQVQGLYNQNVQLASESPNAYNERVGEAMFSRQRSLLDPVFQQQDRSLEQKLANQGLPMGGEAYNEERNRFDRMRNEAYSNAANQSVLSGTQAGSQQRTQQFNELAALLGGQQVGPTAPIDVMGPANLDSQNQWNSYNAGMAKRQQTTQNATALAAILAMAMCWVAEELYGMESHETRAIRAYLNARPHSLFAKFYQKAGIKWAALVRLSKTVRVVTKVIFDSLYVMALRNNHAVAL